MQYILNGQRGSTLRGEFDWRANYHLLFTIRRMNSLRTNSGDPVLRKTQRRSNQCKPTRTSTVVFFSFSIISQFSIASDEDLFPVVLYYWHLGLSDEKIVEHARDHFDSATFGFR